MPPLTRTRTAVCAAALLVAAGAFAVRAQDAEPPAAEAPEAAPPAAEAQPATPAEPDPEAIVARVGEETVTEGEIAIAREALGDQLGAMPPEAQRSALVDALVSMELLALAARETGLHETPAFEERLAFLELQAQRNAYVEEAVVNGLTEAELREGYQTLVVGEHQPQQEVRARHILVDTKEEAEKIIAELEGGASFEELAKQSKDPSGQNGGDLGFFGPGQMVPEFETAAFALEPGEVTPEPVQSQFGWHVIKLEEKRMSEPPSFEDVEQELRTYMMRQKFEEVLAELRGKYPVEIVGAPAEEPAEAAPAEGETPGGEAPEAAPAEPAENPAEGGEPAQ